MKTFKNKGGGRTTGRSRNTGTRRKKNEKKKLLTKVAKVKNDLKNVLSNLKNEKDRLEKANIVFVATEKKIRELKNNGDNLTKERIKDIEKIKKLRNEIKEFKEFISDYSSDITYLIKEAEGFDSDDSDYENFRIRQKPTGESDYVTNY